MAAPTPTVIYNSGRGLRRHGLNTAAIFATWPDGTQWSNQALLILNTMFTQQPFPLGIDVHKIIGSISGSMTQIDLNYLFATPIKLASPVPKDFFLYPLKDAGKSPASELLDAAQTNDWTAGSNVTATSSTSILVDPSTASQILTTSGSFTTGILGYKPAYSAVDARDWDGVSFYIYSSIDLQPGDLSFCIDDTAAIASPVETLVIPMAISKNQWYKVELPFANAASRQAIVSHGLIANRAIGVGAIYIDNIRYKKINRRFPSFESGSNNANAAGYGNLIATTVGAASADRLWLEIDFECVWSKDVIR